MGHTMFTVVNPNDKHFTRNRYCLAFDAYGSHMLLVWANGIEDALDECIDWIADHAPGLLADEQVAHEYQRLIAEGVSEEDANTQSTIDITCAGNNGHYILSWEWTIVAENPDRKTLKEIISRCDR
jgi:hypothetical protein